MRERYLHNLAELEAQLREMGGLVERAVREATWALERNEVGFAQRVIASDDLIDSTRYEVENAALNLIARQQPLAGDLRIINTVIGVATELERIGDYAEGIAKLVVRNSTLPPASFPPQLHPMATQAQVMLNTSLQALFNREPNAADRFHLEDRAMDALYHELSVGTLARMREEPPAIERLVYYLQIAHNYERIADRTVNIAERTTYIVTGVLNTKEPLNAEPQGSRAAEDMK